MPSFSKYFGSHVVLICSALCLVTNSSYSQSAKGIKIDAKMPLVIDFIYEPWNKNPNSPDSAVLIIRNSQSNKTVKAILIEDGNNTNNFKGQFFINWETDGTTFQADVFSPPQKAAKLSNSTSLDAMIKEGTLPRKPYFLRKVNGQQKLSVFNSSDQAINAYNTFRQTVINGNSATSKPLIDKAALEAAHNAAIAAEQARLAKIAQQQELIRQEQKEEAKRKQEELQRQQQAMASAERQRRKDQAKVLSKEALSLFQNQKYLDAETKFRQSIELDPGETNYSFQYGATLYKNQKYNEALIAFDLANDPKINQREKLFYQGLCHMKLKEFSAAVEKFNSVVTVNDDTLTPSASFFNGVIFFSQEKYILAKTSFEKTLDTSKDPQLDEQADNYIEQIANIEQFQQKLEKRFTTTLTTGIVYDSNILLVSNSSSSPASATAGFRSLLSANLEYRIIYSQSHELLANLSYSDIYSLDSKFKPSSTLQLADPLVISAKLPYKWKGKFLEKPYLLNITPSFDTLRLNVDGTGSREYTMGTTTLGTEQTFIVRDDYFTILKINWINEDSKIASSGTADAKKILIGNNNLLFRDQKKTQAVILNWSYLMNQTTINDNIFAKLELAGGYLTPVFQKSSWTNMLIVSQSNFSKSSIHRKDSNMNINSSLGSPLTEKLQGAVALGYETNTSTLAASTYKKYTITATANWSLDF